MRLIKNSLKFLKKISIILYILYSLQINAIKITNTNKITVNLHNNAPSLDYDQMIPVEFEQPEK
jgi:hypothetical protein